MNRDKSLLDKFFSLFKLDKDKEANETKVVKLIFSPKPNIKKEAMAMVADHIVVKYDNFLTLNNGENLTRHPEFNSHLTYQNNPQEDIRDGYLTMLLNLKDQLEKEINLYLNKQEDTPCQ